MANRPVHLHRGTKPGSTPIVFGVGRDLRIGRRLLPGILSAGGC